MDQNNKQRRTHALVSLKDMLEHQNDPFWAPWKEDHEVETFESRKRTAIRCG